MDAYKEFYCKYGSPIVSDNKRKGLTVRAGEMAQRLRALTTLPEILSLISSNHMVAHNHL